MRLLIYNYTRREWEIIIHKPKAIIILFFVSALNSPHWTYFFFDYRYSHRIKKKGRYALHNFTIINCQVSSKHTSASLNKKLMCHDMHCLFNSSANERRRGVWCKFKSYLFINKGYGEGFINFI